ncbi:Metal-dependent amidase/aminoacylase/carboxypeptidase [Clostridium collagenovorans DSM 3089]|uniref:Metal-dependent amidase/aminoacylase/carboxypeptidase n=1 Tax=Clostridium collagenovorans DSM 3089 TaxID=1121306 RepID=A0A1M5WJW7_9CLOT|nr:hypothetical protein [Clostridium collagenovorans]SHH87718.1 Metal-dependent amidase/aminoacylase/carboxypeptidase [Clostridium collagenovorans DSM 3089]
MRQQIISYISTIKDELIDLNKYLYDSCEEAFSEQNSSKYICELLRKHKFEVTDNFLDMKTSFYGIYGSGHPKVCYVCKYNGYPEGHIYGNNLSTSMSVGAALALSSVISLIGGSVTIIGCPGDHLNGSELAMVKENIFEDMDVIMCPHSYIDTVESGDSKAAIPLKINYSCDYNSNALNNSLNPALDACLLTFNTLSILIKSSCSKCMIDNISIEAIHCLTDGKQKAEAKFSIKSCCAKYSEDLENKIRNFVNSSSSILGVQGSIELCGMPTENLLSNSTLSRLFTHNLKECGIINIDKAKENTLGLGIGTISHTTPCIYPSIGITKNKDIKFPSPEFGDETLSEYSIDAMITAINALAITGVDVIEKNDLLKEMNLELHKNIK